MGGVKVLAALCAMALVAGCMSKDTERAVVGAAAGAVVADVLDENVVAGAALGGLAGATCDDMGICR